MATLSQVIIFHDQILGKGSYGKVCKAKYGQLPCAAKLLHDAMFEGGDPGIYKFIERFEQECQLLSKIKHPNIVQYLGTSRYSKRLVLLMELMDESLTSYLQRSASPLFYHIQLNICHDVALALSYLHSKAIIHRDLSSNNVLLIGEGTRAKVTDFGMSKLAVVNPFVTPLSLCPGATVYMPPEALTTPPRYSSKLDCFSYGVLAIQVITRNYPNPRDAHNMEVPDEHLLRQVSEIYRRKKDIDLIELDNPLRPILLQSLQIKDTERPSSDELCKMLERLKSSERYALSVDRNRSQASRILQLQEDLEKSSNQLQRERARHRHELICKDEQVELQKGLTITFQDELKVKEEQIARLQEENQLLKHTQRQLRETLLHKDSKIESILTDHKLELIEKEEVCRLQFQQLMGEGYQAKNDACAKFAEVGPKRPEGAMFHFKWSKGISAPESFSLGQGTATASERTAYFSYKYNIHAFSLTDNTWTKLPRCTYQFFSMAVVNGNITTIGGFESTTGSETNSIFTLVSIQQRYRQSWNWRILHPPMVKKRKRPGSISTATHLIVAGGREISQVEILDTKENKQWFVVKGLPQPAVAPQVTLCKGHFYVSHKANVYSCSEEELYESCKPPSAEKSNTWKSLTTVPFDCGASIVTVAGQLLALGGTDKETQNPVKAIHCYDRSSNMWKLFGEICVPRCDFLAAVTANNLMIVGGWSEFGKRKDCKLVIGSIIPL